MKGFRNGEGSNKDENVCMMSDTIKVSYESESKEQWLFLKVRLHWYGIPENSEKLVIAC